jgi:hypothetical protein
MRLQPRRDRDEDRVPSRTPATQQSGWATAATSSAGRSCAVECEEGARCVIAGARSGPRTATRAALGERLHALLKPKWNSQRTIHLEQLDMKARHGRSFAPTKRRLGRIRAEPDSLVAFVTSVVRPATTTSRRASAPWAVTADGWAAEQPAGRPRTVRELGSLYNAYNVYNVYHAYNANAYNVYNVYNVPDGRTTREPGSQPQAARSTRTPPRWMRADDE